MNKEQFARTIRLIGEDNFHKLQEAKVAVYGLGGVGGHAANALCRAGIGHFYLVDGDTVNQSNINRQIVARLSTVGQHKADVMKKDMLDIDPGVTVETHNVFLTPENIESFVPPDADYVIDCIDNITCKLLLAKMCYNKNIPILSSMGAGNRTQAEFIVTDVFKTHDDPVAKVMRRELPKIGIHKLEVVWSRLGPKKLNDGQRTPASISFIPPAAGLKIAEYVAGQLMLR